MIKADVNYDKKTLVDFIRFAMVNRPWKWGIVGGLFLLSFVLMLISIGSKFLSYSVLLFVLVCMAVASLLIVYFLNPLIKLKDFTDEKIVINHFSFEEKVIKLSSESKVRKGSSELPYSAFTKIDESKNAFYLFVNKSSALIVTKSSITDGTVDDLRKFLISKISNRKINKLSVK